MATMFPMEPTTNTVNPMTHVRLDNGFSCAPGARMPMACRFCPMLIPMDETRPMKMPTATVDPDPSTSHTVALVAFRCQCGTSILTPSDMRAGEHTNRELEELYWSLSLPL